MVKPPRQSLRAIAGFGSVLVVAVATLLFIDQRDDTPQQRSVDTAAVSSRDLASFASTRETPVYWAGRLPARSLELTSTDTGAFVRYLPSGVKAGSSTRALTIATYPMPDAYATAAGRAGKPGMDSTRLGNGGLAVWSKAQPTSVYLAFRGVPSLVEVYAPTAKEARTIALSGGVRPVG